MLKTIITAATLAGLASMVMLAQGPASALGAGAAAPQSTQTLLNPPAWVFRLPDNVLGTVEHAGGMTIIHPRGMDASSVALYRWAAAPSINAALTRDYLAQQAVRSGCVGPGSGCAPGMPRPSIVRYPAGGWLYGRDSAPAGSSGSGHYAYTAGAVFHNLTFRVEAWCTLPRAKGLGQDACAAWTVGTLEHLLGRARGYAAQHPHGDPLPPQHSAALG